MDYSQKQEVGHTDVGVTAEMPSQPMPATPDREGLPGPGAQTQFPWPGRAEASETAFDGSAAAFSALAAAAQQHPGTRVDSAQTAGAPNDGPQ